VTGVIVAIGKRRRVRCDRARLLCAFVLALSAALLTACGGDGSLRTEPPGSASNPLVALPNATKTRTPTPDPEDPGSRAAASVQRSSGSIASRQRAAQRAANRRRARAKRGPSPAASASPIARLKGRRTLPSATPVSARRPCTLVTASQAQALMGGPILEPIEAPQGPTCIYRSRSGRNFITLAVQTVDFIQLRSRMRHRRRIEVSDRKGYCGNLGQPVLYIPVSNTHVLSVVAPCALAIRFAARAIGRLPT
jgi:hypothetical protein